MIEGRGDMIDEYWTAAMGTEWIKVGLGGWRATVLDEVRDIRER